VSFHSESSNRQISQLNITPIGRILHLDFPGLALSGRHGSCDDEEGSTKEYACLQRTRCQHKAVDTEKGTRRARRGIRTPEKAMGLLHLSSEVNKAPMMGVPPSPAKERREKANPIRILREHQLVW
jgi:hypothetical protein